MFENTPLLSILIWWPVLAAIVLLFSAKKIPVSIIKKWTVLASLAELLMCIPLYQHFNVNSYEMQFQESHSWISMFGIRYALGIDGISLALILLTAFTTFVVVIGSCKLVKNNIAQYMAAFLMAQAMMIGVFAALDAILFYVFWEAMLIPMFLSIGIWGDKQRSYAAIKFFIYMFLGSVVMLVAILYLHQITHSFEITKFYDVVLPRHVELWLFAAFFIAFAIKLPLWPLHTWLLDVHTESPAGGSVVLASLMLKIGVYGFIRFSMPILPVANQIMAPYMIALALIAIIYVGIMALVQNDMKKLIAYSSIAHMGFAVLGCFMVYSIIHFSHSIFEAYMSFEGAVVQMISHAFNTGGLFLAAGMMQYWVGSRNLKDWGGLAKTMPIFAAFFMLFALSNVGLPGTSGFVGEFMVIVAAFHADFCIALFASLTLVIAAAYTLLMVKKIFFGPITNHKVEVLQDIGIHEIFVFGLLSIGIIFIGVYPQWLLEMLHASVGHLLNDSLMFGA
ncbi:MAG: NADH-quinone oxidoreductase subunit M [Pseudomonadota bacterium]